MKFKTANKIKIEDAMSSMTDLDFLLLIFFIIISTLVNTSHNIDLPDGVGDPSLSSPVKVYINNDNSYFINSNQIPISIENLKSELLNKLGENSTIELLADKDTDRKFAYEVIKIAKQEKLKVVIKTKGS